MARSLSRPTSKRSSRPSNRSSSAEASGNRKEHTMNNELKNKDLLIADGGLAQPQLANVEIAAADGGDLSRSDVILKGVLAAGAVYGTFMVAPFIRSAFAASGSSDVDILNFALTLEYLESTFYEEAKKRVKATGELKKLLPLLASDEKQHVEALEGTIKKLGGK